MLSAEVTMSIALNSPQLTISRANPPSTPTWRAGDEENGEGQFGGVSHFPSESDPLTKKSKKKYKKKQNLKKTESD